MVHVRYSQLKPCHTNEKAEKNDVICNKFYCIVVNKKVALRILGA